MVTTMNRQDPSGKKLAHRRTFSLLLVLLTCLVALPSAADARNTVRLALQWYPQTQFAGYYMAKEKGIPNTGWMWRSSTVMPTAIHLCGLPPAKQLASTLILVTIVGYNYTVSRSIIV